MITCKYYDGSCDLGFFGGKPLLGNCRACIEAEENTPEFAAILKERLERSHPPTARRVSGCCDRADQS
jgi:hypothetical protein